MKVLKVAGIGCASLVGLFLFLCLCVAVCGPGPSNTNSASGTKASKQVPDLQVLSHKWERGKFGTNYVAGVIRNNRDRKYNYVQVEVNLYASDGKLLDSTLDNVNNLDPGAEWSFRAVVLRDGVSRYEIEDVSGW